MDGAMAKAPFANELAGAICHGFTHVEAVSNNAVIRDPLSVTHNGRTAAPVE
jgi:hypothetical protein